MSPQQLLRGDLLVQEVATAIRDSGIPAAALCLEITESSVLAETEVCMSAVRSLAALGVELAVDDFGTGYSSLSYLTRLPVSTVKADRSFVAALAREEPGGEIVSAVIGLAQGLRLSTVAEGVERVEQVEALSRLGCDRAQGYLFSPAVPAEQLPGFLGRALW